MHPKILGEAMQKVQDLHIKHLYALGEDQQDSSTENSDVLPEITVNEENTCDNRGWYWDRHHGCKTCGKPPDRTIMLRR